MGKRQKEDRVAIRVEILRALDREVEIRSAELNVPKRQFIEDALRRALAT